MPSIFSREPEDKKPLDAFDKERIEKEIGHLKKKKAVRTAREQSQTLGLWVTSLAIIALLVLFFWDPFMHSWERGTAIRTYLYLHNSGREDKAQEIAATGIFATSEITVLNRRQGSYQDYFATPAAANDSADAIARYMKGVTDLHEEHYDRLDTLGKIRYVLFVRWGLNPPTQWSVIDPSVSG